MNARLLLFALLLSISAACAKDVNSDGIVKYRDRAIDVRAYVEGFPYKSFYFAPDAGKVFFLHRGDQELLHEADFSVGSPVDFKKARPLSHIDFTKRNFWGLAVSSWNKRVYIVGDEDNSEITNIYELERSGALKKLTAEGYIYDWELSPDGRQIAFAARSSNREFTLGSVGVLARY